MRDSWSKVPAQQLTPLALPLGKNRRGISWEKTLGKKMAYARSVMRDADSPVRMAWATARIEQILEKYAELGLTPPEE